MLWLIGIISWTSWTSETRTFRLFWIIGLFEAKYNKEDLLLQSPSERSPSSLYCRRILSCQSTSRKRRPSNATCACLGATVLALSPQVSMYFSLLACASRYLKVQATIKRSVGERFSIIQLSEACLLIKQGEKLARRDGRLLGLLYVIVRYTGSRGSII